MLIHAHISQICTYCITFSLATICRVAQEHEEAQLRRMRELEERLAADRRDRLTVGHDRR